jgi:hypothetical protein
VKKKLLALFILPLLVAGSLGSVFTPTASAVTAADWKAGRIIDDGKFTNLDMSVADIQNFLNAKVPVCDTWGTQPASEYGRSDLTHAQYAASRGWPAPPYVCLKNYHEVPKTAPGPGVPLNSYNNGGNPPAGSVSAAQMIYNAAQLHRISPKVLLVKLATESAGPLTTDKWPLQKQYTYAMGAYCPDSGPGGSANCNTNYAGFSIQIAEAAELLRWYLDSMTQSWWQHKKPFQTNNILWNVAPSNCGGGNVYIETMGTAALYTYTPYQPNAAALNNMYGTGNGCSAYGNRNFWRVYNDWFGPSRGGVTLGKKSSSATVYLIADGHKYGIPSQAILEAWGLNTLSVSTYPDSTIDAITDRGVLGRVAKNPYSPGLYLFADKGGTYDTLAPMVSNWGFNPTQAPTIGADLISHTNRLGSLSAFTTSPGSNGVYLIDGGTKRMFPTPNMLNSWAGNGPIISVSDNLITSLANSTGVSSTQAESNGIRYLLASGKAKTISAENVPLYEQPKILSISSSLTAALPKGGSVSKIIRNDAGTIFLMDEGNKHGFTAWDIYSAYGSNVAVTQISNNDAANIPSGANIQTRFVYSSSDSTKQYFVSSGKYSLPPTFVASGYGYAMSEEGVALLGSDKGLIGCKQGLVQAMGSAGIYILDNGKKRGIPSLDTFAMIDNKTGSVCQLSQRELSLIPSGGNISPFVTDGSNKYLIEGSKKYAVDNPTAINYGVANYTTVSADFLNLYTTSGALESKIRTPSSFVLVNSAKFYNSSNATIAKLWNITTSSQLHSDPLLKFVPRGGALTQFARSTNSTSGTIYVVDGSLFPLQSINHLFNAGYSGQDSVKLDPTYISSAVGSAWHGYLAKDVSNNKVYVLEGGKKHFIPDSLLPRWLGSSSPATPSNVSASFISTLTTAGDVTKSVSNGQPGIYAIIDGKKSGIPNMNTYLTLYSPALTIDDHLLKSIPTGAPAPSI